MQPAITSLVESELDLAGATTLTFGREEPFLMKQTITSYVADILVAVAAIVAASLVAGDLHGRWYYGEWMQSFGDPPMSNPSYSDLSPLFEAAPYMAAGVIVGLISGFGRAHPVRIAIRAVAPILLFMLLRTGDKRLAESIYFPAASKAFVFSVVTSAIYFWILNTTSKQKNLS